MSAQPKIYYSEADYLEIEQTATYKSEYINGEIYAMAGGSTNHNRIVGNLYVAIGSYLKRKKCKFFPSDMKIYVPKHPFYAYPDVSIVCEKPEYSLLTNHAITNPSVIIEVLSKSTENYDKSLKFDLYSKIQTLKEYILISSTDRHVMIYRRNSNDYWELSTNEHSIEKTIFITEIGLEIPLFDIYEDSEIE